MKGLDREAIKLEGKVVRLTEIVSNNFFIGGSYSESKIDGLPEPLQEYWEYKTQFVSGSESDEELERLKQKARRAVKETSWTVKMWEKLKPK